MCVGRRLAIRDKKILRLEIKTGAPNLALRRAGELPLARGRCMLPPLMTSRSHFWTLAPLVLGCVAGTLALGGTSNAQTVPTESPSDFQWEAPPECPARNEVLARTFRNLGRAASIRGQGTVTKPGRYRLRLHLIVNDSETEREIFADQCDSLADAAALIAALAVDPEETLRRQREAELRKRAIDDTPDAGAAAVPSSDVAPSKPPPPDAGARGDAESERPVRASAARVGGFIALAGAGDVGTLPSLSPGIGLEGGLDIAWFRPTIAVYSYLSEEARGRTPSVGARFALRTASISGCVAPFQLRPFDPGLCAAVAVDWVHASAFGAIENLSEDVFWISLGLSLDLRLYLSRRVFLGARPGLWVPLAHRTFSIAGEGNLHTPSSVTFRGTVGPGIVF